MKMRDKKGRYIKGHPTLNGANHPNWKGGYPDCELCGHKLSNRKHKRCAKCRNIGRKLTQKHRSVLSETKTGKKNPSYIDGRAYHKCMDCGKITRSKFRCRQCFLKFFVGSNCPRWKGGYENRLWHNNRRRIIKLQNGGFHTLGEWEHLKALYNWTCPKCWKKEPQITLSRDHIIPLSKGGSDDIKNIQPLCRSCNSRKSNKLC